MNTLKSSSHALIGLLVFFPFVHWAGFAGQNPTDEKAMRNLVEGYLKAKNWKDRLAFVQDPSKQEAAMEKRYQGEVFQLQNQTIQMIEEMAKLPGKFLVTATWKSKSQGYTGYYVVGKGTDGMKIDWPASAGYNPVSLKSLVMNKTKGTHTLRLIATADSKYVDDYANTKDTHYCFLLKEDNPLQTVQGYIPKDNADGQRLMDLLKRRQPTKDRVIVEIQFTGPNGQDVKSGRTVSISKLLSDTWVAAP